MKASNIGSSFDDFLEEEGLYEEVTAVAINKLLAAQVASEMKKKHIKKTEMANKMNTSRSTLDRLLDPNSNSINLATIEKAAKVLGKKIELKLI